MDMLRRLINCRIIIIIIIIIIINKKNNNRNKMSRDMWSVPDLKTIWYHSIFTDVNQKFSDNTELS